jgi:hypothetical protein
MRPYEKQWSSATPGLLIILIDQSGSMLSKYEGNDSKTVFATKAVNRVIDNIIQKNFDGESPKNRCFITVIGYNNDAKELCSGYLKDLDAHPLRRDSIKKKVSDGAGGIVEVETLMPIWVEPIRHDGTTNMKGAFELSKAIIERWINDNPDSPAPVIINISDGAPYYNHKEIADCMKETAEVARDIMNISVADGNVLIFNALIRESGLRREFPTSLDECPTDEAQFLYSISSFVPDAYQGIAQVKELNVKEGSKGCIFEADEVQLISLIDFGSSKGQRDI